MMNDFGRRNYLQEIKSFIIEIRKTLKNVEKA